MIIGMDFGTTNSGIATYDGQRLRLIPIDGSSTVTRTALYITNDRQFTIGRSAIDTYFQQNLNRPVRIERAKVGEIQLTFAEVGTFFRDVWVDKDVLSPGRLFVSFKTALSSLDYLGTVVGSHFYFLEDIIALYLYIAKQHAEAALQTEIKQIALGRPVRFAFKPEDDALARERLLKAAFRAGYEEVYLQYEPIAAAYSYESTIDREQIVLVFDFGGGTLDLSVLRVGNPKTRAVLATGGVPIAGDVFDSKLSRARLPKHFGEGSTYRSGGQRLPVPSAFYEAFANWQEMLTLQRPDLYGKIERIEQTAQRPQQIHALLSLISSSYGLKMFDIVEASKRQLSTAERSAIKLEERGFNVYEPVTRPEFEAIIGPETRMIEEYLDNLLRDAGIRADDIDVVIRTGGSSQIPAFVQMLEARFGDRVRAVDTFSSVTSGLGIIAHGIEHGEIDAKVYRARDFPPDVPAATSDTPAVDFEVLKKFVAFTETGEAGEKLGTVALDPDGGVHAALKAPANADLRAPRLIATSADDPLLLMTSEYRFLLKTTTQLATLDALGLTLASAEGFHADEFGAEHVTGIASWKGITADAPAVLISTSGHFKAFKGEALISRVEQPVGYTTERIKGDPFTLVTGKQIVAFSDTGRAARLPIGMLEQAADGRLLRVDRVIAAFGIDNNALFLLAAPDGTITTLRANSIPLATELSTTGEKVFAKRELCAVARWRLDDPFWIATNQRVFRHEPDGAPGDGFSLAKGETLLSVITT